MGKKQDQMFAEMMAMYKSELARMRDPASNPAQQYLTNEALAGADWMKKGDFSALPKGMFFDFKMPSEQNEQYKKYANVNQGGTFALGDSGGQGAAQGIQSQFLKDRFARDASQNYQSNVSNAAQNIRGGLGAAAGANTQNSQNIIGALQGMGSMINSMPQKTPWWQTLLGQVGGLAGAGASAYAAGKK